MSPWVSGFSAIEESRLTLSEMLRGKEPLQHNIMGVRIIIKNQGRYALVFISTWILEKP
jgi:hypothetical protein